MRKQVIDIKTGTQNTTHDEAQGSVHDVTQSSTQNGSQTAGNNTTSAQPAANFTTTTQPSASEPETIRIFIRDAKPPLFARALQGFMRLVCLLLLIAVCGIGIPCLFGVNEFNVETGSMSPEYPIGTLIFVQPKDPYTIRPGEVATVIMNEELDMLTHRVVSNNYEQKTITTKGDANNTEDGPSMYENVVGVVSFSVPYVGQVVNFVTNTETGRVMGVGVLIGVLALTFLAEGICSLLTRQSARAYGVDNKPLELKRSPRREQKRELNRERKGAQNREQTAEQTFEQKSEHKCENEQTFDCENDESEQVKPPSQQSAVPAQTDETEGSEVN